MSTSAQRNLPSIRTKLAWLVVASLGVALITASVIGMWQATNSYLRVKRETLLATAQIFSAAVSEAASRGDSFQVEQGLRAVARVPRLIRAEVATLDGQQIGEIGAAARLASDLDISEDQAEISLLSLLSSDTVKVSAPVVHGGKIVGRLTVVGDISELPRSLVGILAYALLGSVFALVPGLLLAQRLQRSISLPLIRLQQAMGEVARTGAYHRVSIDASYKEADHAATSYNDMIGEIGRATDKILARENEIIERLSRAGEMRDDQTGQHVVRVAKISRIIAEEVGLDPSFIDDLCRASPMHDVGKISIPDAILHKPSRLSPKERREMERHAARGFELLAGSESALVQLAAEIALCHHERWDGAGYPRGLAGESIPISGRITAIADVCDALISERPYKSAWSLEEVKRHLEAQSGRHFDPVCVNALLASWERLESVYASHAPHAHGAPALA